MRVDSRNAVWLVSAALVAGCGGGPDPADLVLSGGVVWTGVPGAADAEAVAVRGDRIVAAGSVADVEAYVGPATRRVDLAGRMVVPGFVDDHVHFMAGGFQLGSVDLRNAANPAEFTRRIAAFGQGLPAGRWVTGGDWDHERWPGAPLPHRAWIDSVTAGRPVSVNRLDGHMVLVNTVALEMAGITRDTPDPPGGTIVRDGAGEPTGVLKDEAMSLVGRHIPDPDGTERDEAFARAQAHALSVGLTRVHDMGSWQDLETWRRARAADRLVLRIQAYVPLAGWERLRDLVAREGRGDERLGWGGLKGFVDGSLGSTTAWFHEPYLDEPGTSGLMVTDTARLRSWIGAADSAGLQVVVHAIGDRANDWLLDVLAYTVARNGPRDRRFRVEHAQHLTPDAIARFGEAGVLPSMQPYHAVDDGRWAGKRIGPERVRTTYAFRSLLDAGAGLMFGSDWTVAPLAPLAGIQAAVTRATIDGANPGGWVPGQKVTVEEALRAYTAANAFGAFHERDEGTIEAGRRADLTVLGADIRSVAPAAIGGVSVEMTVIGGKVAFEKGAAGPTAEGAVR